MMRKFCWVLLAWVLSGCWEAQITNDNIPVVTDSLRDYLEEQGIRNVPEIKGVFVVGDGGCINCNRVFSLKVSEWLGLENFVWVISAAGVQSDISSFLNHRNDNIIIDRSNDFFSQGFFKGSGFIGMLNGNPDTVIPMMAEGIELRLKFINDYVNRDRFGD